VSVIFASGTRNFATSRHSFVVSFVNVRLYRTLPTIVAHYTFPYALFTLLIGKVAVPEAIFRRKSTCSAGHLQVRLSSGYSMALGLI
jgi:hypothetical protein